MFRNFTGFKRRHSGKDPNSRFNQQLSVDADSHGPSTPNPDIVRQGHVAPITSLPQLPQAQSSADCRASRTKAETPDSGPLGLSVVYTPDTGHKVDIVFVHGLGGTSRWTWSKNKDANLFWPRTFLPLEPDMCFARILTFGYNAAFRKAGSVGTSVLDFAKELLFALKYAKDENKDDLNMGAVPLIFVVHSMGGLIVKEAYLLGQNDPGYEAIIKAIAAITFLATPHRGTNLAKILNRILQSTMVTNSKQYIADLSRNSITIQQLNEQFRHVAPRLDIYSFYETQPTAMLQGIKRARVMVLKKDSAVLGYPGETSTALDADHHGMCKYDSPLDPNYVSVRNVLVSLVSKIIALDRSTNPPLPNQRESHNLQALLGISELPGIDYSFFRDQWTQGTSDWILEEQLYHEWSSSQEISHRILWLNGAAGTGKSVLSSFIINSLVERGARCQYFFIRFGDQKKRTLGLLLRSIAYQIAQGVVGFLQEVTELVQEAVDFDTADPKTIWNRIYKSVLFRMDETEPLYWVIDGLDEADDPKALLQLLADVALSSMPIRILFTSRRTSEVAIAFERLPDAVHKASISMEGHRDALNHYIRHGLTMRGDSDFRESTVRRIVEGSQDNFLWVRLAVDKVNACHRRADVERALQELPVGMEALYDRMASEVIGHSTATDRHLALSILERVTVSVRVLTVAELAEALGGDASGILDLQKSIADLCGGFVVVDNGGNVAMIHQTAREYLLAGDSRKLSLDRGTAHRQIFLSCMRCLTAVGLRAKVKRNQKPVFLDYSAMSWSSHLTMAPSGCSQTWDSLKKFLRGNWVLTWIHILAAVGQLRLLIRVSENILEYNAQRQESLLKSSDSPNQEWLASWATDFVKIVGKFGYSLLQNPEAIYRVIPPLCPHDSAIYQLFGKSESGNLRVSGLSHDSWDDSLARLSFGKSAYISSIRATGACVAAIAASGTIYLYDSLTFEETPASPINHGERVYLMEMNGAATMLATYGYRTTKVWQVTTGQCKVSVPNPESRPRPLAMLFTDNNNMLTVGTDSKQVQTLDLTDSTPAWRVVAELEEPELEGHFLNAASHMALNKDGTLIAVAYRGHPLSAWETDGPTHLGHCWRKRAVVARGDVIEAVWHPYSTELIGVYIEGDVFKWNPYEDDTQEIPAGASKLALSKDGNLFATGDVRGTVKVFITAGLSQIYQLVSQDSVFGLAFSPDLQRFYDVRGYYANAWEPSALVRFAEQVGKDIDTESKTESPSRSSPVSVSSAHRIDAITVLAASPKGRFYCCGTELGTVRLYDVQRGKLADLYTSKSFFGIEQLCWSEDGRYICFSNLSKRVIIVSVPSAMDASPAIETVSEISVHGSRRAPILQLLVDPKSNFVLVHASFKMYLISLATGSVTKSMDLPDPELKWRLHPHDASLIVGFGPNTVRVQDWDLTQSRVYQVDLQNHPDIGPTAMKTTVDRVITTRDKNHMLVHMSTSGQGVHRNAFCYFPTSSFEAPLQLTAASGALPEDRESLTPYALPQRSSSRINRPLSFLSGDRLVFLSKSFSLCSMRITSSSGANTASSRQQIPVRPKSTAASASTSSTLPPARTEPDQLSVQEYFPLPRDWIGRDSLSLSMIWGVEGSLLVPRNGEIAVVRCTALT